MAHRYGQGRRSIAVVHGKKNVHLVHAMAFDRKDFDTIVVSTVCEPERKRSFPANKIKVVSSASTVTCPVCKKETGL